MSLRIVGSAEDVTGRMREAIEQALPGAMVRVTPTSPGHFELHVVCEAFRDLPRVRQHQLVYAAIAPLMQGDAPPVHAIDRLQTELPG